MTPAGLRSETAISCLSSGVISDPVDSHRPRGVFESEQGAFLLALAAVCTVAVLEAVLGTRPALVELLLVGPLIAAAGANVQQASAGGVLSPAAAVRLGGAGDAAGPA